MTSYIVCCENLACRAALGNEVPFAEDVLVVYCHKFDDNKDPSLWLTCEACGLSCHLECSLKQERYEGGRGGLDGRFYCAFCGKDNDLLGCWRKQVKVAKETRRVDVLCYRVSLGQKLLRGTRRYRNLLEFMDEAVKKLEGYVDPLSGWAMKMARGIVIRLPLGSQVQELCALAMEALDKMVSSSESDDIEDARNRTNSSSGLCSNPSLPKDESNNVRKSCSKESGDKDNIEHCSAGEVESELEDQMLVKRKVDKIDGRDLLITPCKRDTLKGKQGESKRSKSRIEIVNNKPEIDVANGVGDKDLSHIVKTIRCLEEEGHIDKCFRERFLTWYSLRATHREVTIVKLFVETFMEDLSSLGQQLVDTFTECILRKRSSTSGVVPAGICLKLWH